VAGSIGEVIALLQHTETLVRRERELPCWPAGRRGFAAAAACCGWGWLLRRSAAAAACCAALRCAAGWWCALSLPLPACNACAAPPPPSVPPRVLPRRYVTDLVERHYKYGEPAAPPCLPLPCRASLPLCVGGWVGGGGGPWGDPSVLWEIFLLCVGGFCGEIRLLAVDMHATLAPPQASSSCTTTSC
jgi:hypothetical protein